MAAAIVVAVASFGLGVLYGLGQTLRILRDVRDRIPADEHVARAALGEAITRFRG